LLARADLNMPVYLGMFSLRGFTSQALHSTYGEGCKSLMRYGLFGL
jgi:hypothetical protein